MISGVDEGDASVDKVSSLLRRDRSDSRMELTPHTNNPQQNAADSPQMLDGNNSNQSKISPNTPSAYDV